jgi:hypothetical protein
MRRRSIRRRFNISQTTDDGRRARRARHSTQPQLNRRPFSRAPSTPGRLHRYPMCSKGPQQWVLDPFHPVRPKLREDRLGNEFSLPFQPDRAGRRRRTRLWQRLRPGAPQDNVPGHPRVNEVNQCIDNQQTRIDKGVADGTITSTQAARDEKHDANIAQRTRADEARHNGHLTKRETARLNRSENRNSRHIRHQRKH